MREWEFAESEAAYKLALWGINYKELTMKFMVAELQEVSVSEVAEKSDYEPLEGDYL